MVKKKRRDKPRRGFAGALHGLRNGDVSFDQFVRQTRTTWERMSSYFLGRWPGQAAADEDDLRQEMLIAVWRSVSQWDPKRGPTLERYVFYQVGLAATGLLRKMLGNPRKGKPAIWSLPLPKRDPVMEPPQFRLSSVRQLLEQMEVAGGMEGRIAGALLRGLSFSDVARALYEDTGKRVELRLGSESQAQARVRAIARRVEARVSA